MNDKNINSDQSLLSRPSVLSNSRQNSKKAAYGGLIFAQALAATERTVDDSMRPHSTHSYFILNGRSFLINNFLFMINLNRKVIISPCRGHVSIFAKKIWFLFMYKGIFCFNLKCKFQWTRLSHWNIECVVSETVAHSAPGN